MPGEKEADIRNFADVVRQLNGGETYDSLTAQLSEIVSGVMETGKAGELSIKLKVRPNGPNSVSIIDEVKIKVPENPRPQTIFFASENGDLLREDPRQIKLPLRDVTAGGEKEAASGG